MRKKIVFLDRDGVINRDPGRGGYVTTWDKFEFLPGSLEAMKRLNLAGYELIVISNQAGIGKGLYSQKNLNEITANMLKEIERAGARIRSVHYCPHQDEDNCNCRKPKTGMLSEATRGLEVDFTRSYFLGDKAGDILAGRAVGCKTIFVLCGMTKLENLKVKPDFIARDLLEATEEIILKYRLSNKGE